MINRPVIDQSKSNSNVLNYGWAKVRIINYTVSENKKLRLIKGQANCIRKRTVIRNIMSPYL